MGFILYFLVIAAAMLGLARFLPGFEVTGWQPAVLASVCLGVVNAVVKPILFLLTLPFTVVTLGLFLFLLNAAMLWLTALIVPGFRVHGFLPTLIASVILSLVGMIWKALTKEPRSRRSK